MNVTKAARRSIVAPIAACLSIVAAAGLGGLATSSAIGSGWYATIEKSALNPPNAVFGPVWSFLYTLIAVAFCLVWSKAPAERSDYKWIFGIQIGLNLLWSLVFFGMRSPMGGFVVIIGLIVSIIAMIVSFRRYDAFAGWMMVPYLAWVSFATYLNAAIANLN